MSRLAASFQDQKNFIAFVTANDPDLETTVANVVALAEGGADIVAIGIPFSDPVADGPVIQAADLRALRDPNLPIATIFEAVGKIREQTDVPLVFLVYLNVVLQYGYEAFAADCAKFGVDGLIIPDLPYEERDELAPITKAHGIDLIPLITVTSAQRIPMIAEAAEGFIYLVSSLGVTGEREQFAANLSDVAAEIKAVTTVPVAIGFGVHSASQAHDMAQLADGVIIGSACVKIVAEYGRQAPAKLKEYAATIKAAI
ncbi:tryptophan synthase subunit alpha [Fructobacillus pseudoficulneus]|uniref:Tryptophan synthase alpha chain n=1 Tax=Fructobacillus pseudoficulneus TaxID=220714 RepID=A0A3F3GSB1_9LACO|nr:tryptophan synthase subunit alpha [Fructobacillus pseudoficulneus]GAP02494.1 tryptophan synthase subunit alpha [Fructobacillus pseudoficulneus]SEH37258.1 tryptophan synthase, alpha chain [Fructobacillus pseudoficulneus]